jgi:hypothetical protein
MLPFLVEVTQGLIGLGFMPLLAQCSSLGPDSLPREQVPRCVWTGIFLLVCVKWPPAPSHVFCESGLIYCPIFATAFSEPVRVVALPVSHPWPCLFSLVCVQPESLYTLPLTVACS